MHHHSGEQRALIKAPDNAISYAEKTQLLSSVFLNWVCCCVLFFLEGTIMIQMVWFMLFVGGFFCCLSNLEKIVWDWVKILFLRTLIEVVYLTNIQNSLLAKGQWNASVVTFEANDSSEGDVNWKVIVIVLIEQHLPNRAQALP